METSSKTNPMSLGRKVSRIRELRGFKQDYLATELGISQQAISKLEQSDDIEDSTLDKIAVVLGVSREAIKNYSDEAVIYNIQNNYDTSVVHSGPSVNQNCTFNPLDELVKAFHANTELYERLLASEREKVEMLRG
jgi:transcriptional regulator with XRE-family HTH domain